MRNEQDRNDSVKKLKSIHASLKTYCTNPNGRHFAAYGGRGATICPEWMDKNGNSRFADWALDNGYEPRLNLMRRDKTLPYSPANCCFADRKTVHRNKATVRPVHFKGVKTSLGEAIESFLPSYDNVVYTRVRLRIDAGWSITDAVTKPPKSTM
ncbi:hypothetical protein [Hymenobacter siberiensis]|uniref:hypothetical protein n=1 Tax=Hymenobacter siberiensis TaxID=2848396 RepID=UPI001C1E1778|nr:hypothetical protein [Hymenobacter siberiensis]